MIYDLRSTNYNLKIAPECYRVENLQLRIYIDGARF